MIATLHLRVEGPGHSGAARRQAVAWAIAQGCDADETGQLAISVSELAGNLGLHSTHGGELMVRLLATRPCAFELLSLDKGPGMQNFAECLRDGYSTAGTAGQGLGAIYRASTLFEVQTRAGQGTALLSQVHLKERTPSALDGLGVINVPKKGETVCGDTCGFVPLERGRARLMIADGLGHGPFAAEASQLAVRVFSKESSNTLKGAIESIHGSLKTTRGAALAIAEIDAGAGVITYAGIGNISGVILGESKAVHMVSMNGTVGAVLPSIREFTYPWAPGSLLVMFSDGIKTQWRLDDYPGILQKHPALTAGVLYRDFARGNDDATVAALKLPYERRG